MRLAIIRAGVVWNTCEGELRVTRAMFPNDEVIPLADTSAAEPGAAAAILQRWPADAGAAEPWVQRGRVRRVRFTRGDGTQTEDTHRDGDT